MGKDDPRTREAKPGATGDQPRGAEAAADKRKAARVEPESPRPELFPDATSLFGASKETLRHALKNGDIVLDTNVLLLPYRAGKDSLNRITAVFSALASAGRLFVPGQVAREYARNRPKVLAELIQKLADHKSKISAPAPLDFPLLEALPEYQALRSSDLEVKERLKAYTKAFDVLLDAIQSWGLTDPVQQRYEAIFKAAQVTDPKVDHNVARASFRARVEHLIPPGYKDASKDDGGIGDFLIWLTILELAAARRRSVVFVTGEEKADWVHRANNQPLMPRVELVDEFRRKSSGATFHIASLSVVLGLLGDVPAETIERVRAEERRVRERVEEKLTCPFCSADVVWRMVVGLGETAKPICTACDRAFHAHRTSRGMITRRPRSRADGANVAMGARFGPDHAALAEILFEDGPIGINVGGNADEYDPEVRTILPRLEECSTVDDVQTLLYQHFCAWFGPNIAGSRERYRDAATRVFAELRHLMRSAG